MRFEDLRKRLLDEIVDGAGLYISKKLGDLANEYLAPYTAEYSAPALKIGVSLLDLILPQIRFPYVGDWLKVIGSDGVRDLVVLLVDKAPLCYAKEESIIRCVNLDTTNVTVKVDGAPITGFSIVGSAEDFEIHLPTPLSGVHDLVVVGDKKAFSGKINFKGV